jgi:hypothetical protein
MARRLGTPNPDAPKLMAAIQRITLRPGHERTTRFSFRVSSEIKKAITIRAIEENYGSRGKSRWVIDAVREFLDPATWAGKGTPGERERIWKRIVVDTELHKERLTTDVVNLPDDVRTMLWRAAIEAALYGAEQDDPVYLEVSISSVIRAAVMWKLGRARSLAAATVAAK